MEEFRMNFTEELKGLDVEDEEEVTAKMLSSKFKKKALKVHPDKKGDAHDDEDFKTLLNDYNTCMEALGLIAMNEEEKEKNEMSEFFAKHNVAKENTNSYTVLIENERTVEWKDVLKKMKHDVEPKKLINGGTQYKTEILGTSVSISLYDNPSNGQSKLLIQGSMFHIRMFIVEELPSLYKKVCVKTMKKQPKKIQPHKTIALRAIKGKEVTFNCDQCDVTYKRKFYLAKHMTDKHDPTQSKKIEKATKELSSTNKANPTPTVHNVHRGLTITPVLTTKNTTPDKENHNVITTTEKEVTNKSKKDSPSIDPVETLEGTTLERTIELESELSGLLDILNEKAKEVVKEKLKENPKKAVMEKATTTYIDLTKSLANPEDDEIEYQSEKDKEESNVFKLIAKIVSDMAEEAIVKFGCVTEDAEDVAKQSIEFEIFKEFEETKDKDKHKRLPDEVYVCGECGMFAYERGRMLTHMEKTHNENKIEDLKTDNKRAYKELSEIKATLYEVQLQLQEAEETLAETMSEVTCLEEDNRDKAKMVDSLLAERSTVDEYDEDSEELGFWNAANEETTSKNGEPYVVEEERSTNDEYEEDGEELGFWNAATEETTSKIEVSKVVEEERSSNSIRSASLDSRHQKCPLCDFVPSRPVYMKSHMLIKHKGDQPVCLKCNKTFPTLKDMNDHIEKIHQRNMHLCNHCEAKFLVAHALKQHIKAVHKEAQRLPVGHPERAAKQANSQQSSHTRFKCKNCQKGHTSGVMLDEHLTKCAPEQTRLLCKFFVKGRCTRGRWCMFSHHIQENHTEAPAPPPTSRPKAPQSSEFRNQRSDTRNQRSEFRNQECRRGPQCHFLAQNRCQFVHLVQNNQSRQNHKNNQQNQPRQQQNMMTQQQQLVQNCLRGPECAFWARGTCYYWHEEVQMQQMWQQTQQQPQEQQSYQVRACRYQDGCNRVPTCPFFHYNEDFPEGLGRQRKR